MQKIHGGEQVFLKLRAKVTKVIEKDVTSTLAEFNGDF